jgi:hypothetical protein
MRTMLLIVALVAGGVAALPASQTLPPARTPGSRLTTQHTCAASLGTGVKSRRTFCDVITAAAPAESVSMAVPARTGPATLFFDLHNRFALPVVTRFPGASYTRHEAVVRLIRADGEVLGRAAVIREFRTTADLFDQLAGGGRPGGVKGVAPGPPEAVRFAIPAGVVAVGIVGERLRVRTATGGDDTYDAPGRPVAIVSNVRLDYRPPAR